MSKDIVSPIPRGQGHEFLNKLEAAGLTSSCAQLVIDSKDNELAEKLVTFIRTGGYTPTVSQKTARAIQGPNYIGVEKSVEYLKVTPSKWDLKALEEVPFSEAALRACRDTHILVAVLPLSVMGLWGRTKNLFYARDDSWYRNQTFARGKGKAGWHLIRKDIVPNSTSRTWQEQQGLLGKDDESPTARVLIYAVILTFLVTGAKLLMNTYARVTDVDSVGNRVHVGGFDGHGLEVNRYWDDNRLLNIGVSSSRKS